MSTQPAYIVQGADGQSYPADASALAEWIRTRAVGPDQMVFVTSEQRWVRVGDLKLPTARGAKRRGVGKPIAIGCLILLGIVVVLSLIGTLVEPGQKKRMMTRREAERLAEEKRLRNNAPAAAKRLAAILEEHDAATLRRDLSAADSTVTRATLFVEPYLALQPPPQELAPLLERYRAVKKTAELRKSLLTEHYNEVVAKQGEAERLIQSEQWSEAAAVLKNAQRVAEREMQQQKQSELVMPRDFAPAIRHAEIDKRLRSISGRAERALEERRESERLAAVCGKKPLFSPFDGGDFRIERELKKRAHDPGSIEVTNCTSPLLYADTCWNTTCDVRGKNAFGALVLSRRRFSISSRGVREIK